MTALFVEGIRSANDMPFDVAPDELAALDAALAALATGDVVAMMCIEEGPAVRERLGKSGKLIG